MCSSKKALFRVDASSEIGYGHAMRCMTLAKKISSIFDIVFVARCLPSDIILKVEKMNAEVFLIPYEEVRENHSIESLIVNWVEDANAVKKIISDKFDGFLDLLVVDHYGLDYRWEHEFSSCLRFVIDDLANRRHECELLLDQNLWPEAEKRYSNKVPIDTKLLLGPEFSLLRDEFYLAKNKPVNPFKIVVFFGGGGCLDLCIKVLKAYSLCLERNPRKAKSIMLHVVVGGQNIGSNLLTEYMKLSPENVFLYPYVDDLCGLMAGSEYVFGAGGSGIWERMCLNLEQKIVSVAHNQEESCAYLASLGLIDYLGGSDQVSITNFVDEFLYVLDEKRLTRGCNRRSNMMVDGLGASKVSEIIINAISKEE